MFGLGATASVLFGPVGAIGAIASDPGAFLAGLSQTYRNKGLVGTIKALTVDAVADCVTGTFTAPTAGQRGANAGCVIEIALGVGAATGAARRGLTALNTRTGGIANNIRDQLADLRLQLRDDTGAIRLGGGADDARVPAPQGPGSLAQPLPAGESPYQLQLFPTTPYHRVSHYGHTPTAAQRSSVPPGMEFDHTPPLVQHYYEGPGDGSLPGFNLTHTERLEYARSLTSGQAAWPGAQRAQGATMAHYSMKIRQLWGGAW